MMNLVLKQIILEEVIKYLEEMSPEEKNTSMLKHIRQHMMALNEARKVFFKINSVSDLEKVANSLHSIKSGLDKSGTLDFFTEVFKDEARSKQVNNLFNLYNLNIRIIKEAKAAINTLVMKAEVKVNGRKEPKPSRSTNNDSKSTLRGIPARGSDTTRNIKGGNIGGTKGQIGEEVSGQSRSALKGAASEVQKMKTFLKSHSSMLIGAGNDPSKKEVLQKEISSLQNGLDGFLAALQQHINSDTPHEGEDLEQEQPMMELFGAKSPEDQIKKLKRLKDKHIKYGREDRAREIEDKIRKMITKRKSGIDIDTHNE
jgi:hypothetical protein